MKTEAEIKDILALVTRSKERIKATNDVQLITNVATVIDILNWVLDDPNTLTSLIDALKVFDASANAKGRASRQ